MKHGWTSSVRRHHLSSCVVPHAPDLCALISGLYRKSLALSLRGRDTRPLSRGPRTLPCWDSDPGPRASHSIMGRLEQGARLRLFSSEQVQSQTKPQTKKASRRARSLALKRCLGSLPQFLLLYTSSPRNPKHLSLTTIRRTSCNSSPP